MGESRDRKQRRSRGTSRNVIDAKTKLEDGTPEGVHGQVVFPSQETIRAAVLEGRCPFCGRGPFTVLARHVNVKHGLDTRELRDLAGLTYKQSIVPTDFHDKKAETSRRLHTAGIMKAGGRHGPYASPQRVSEAGKQRKLRGSQSRRVERGLCVVCGTQIPADVLSRNSTCGRPECVRGSMKTPYKVLDTSEKAEIRQCYSAGVSRRDLARRYGVSIHAIARITYGNGTAAEGGTSP